MTLGRDTLAYWTAQAANFALTFVSSVFVAVILGPEARGLLTAVILANTLAVNLTNLGLQPAAMFFVGKRPQDLLPLHAILILLVAAVAALDLAALLVAGDVLRRRVFDEIARPQLAVAAAALPFSLYYFVAQGVLTGLGRVRELSRFLFYYSVAVNASNLAVVGLAGAQVQGLLAVWFASQAGAAVTLFTLIRRQPAVSAREPLTWRGALAGARELLAYGGRAFVGNVATALLTTLDQLFILAGPGRAGLGIYGLSAKLASLTFQPSAALEQAGFARVAAAEPTASARLVRELFRTNLIINGLGVALMVALARPFLLFFYREEYAPGVVPLQILLPGALFLSGSRMLALYFSAQLGQPQVPSAIAWITLAVNAPMMWWVLVRQEGGLVGAALVTSGSYALMQALYLAFYRARTRRWEAGELFIPRRRDLERFRALAREVIARRGL